MKFSVRNPAASVVIVLALAILVGFNGAIMLAVHKVFPSVGLFPWSGEPEKVLVPPAAKPVVPVAQRSSKLPAQVVVDKVMGLNPPIFASWTPTTPSQNIAGNVFDTKCDAASDVSPAVAGSKGWVKSTYSYSVSARAYSAGLGGEALLKMRDRIAQCAGGWASISTSNGVEVLTGGIREAGVLASRRGDVVVTVVGQSKGKAVSSKALQPIVQPFDVVLASSLRGVCVELDADGGSSYERSPFSGALFTGNIIQRPVKVKVADKALPAGVSAVTIPGRNIGLPQQPYRPTAPDAPVTPSRLPSEVPSPQSPDAPVKSPTASSIKERVADDAGPGCGWAFTGQAPVRFNAEQAKAQAEADYQAMEKQLIAGWDKWQSERIQYFKDYATFEDQAARYKKYVSEVRATSATWERIRTERQEFIDAWNSYVESIRRRDQFVADQKLAKTNYESQLKFCSTAPPVTTVKTPQPTPMSTTSVEVVQPDPVVTTGPDGVETSVPQPSRTVTKTTTTMSTPPPVTSTRPADGCPAVPPAILSQTPPTVFAKPTPPAHMPPEMLRRVTGGK